MLHYQNRYPRSGQIALLCEGDVAGYEVDLLARWTTTSPDLGMVDVWPCGTKTAIYGMTDAIGRSVPTFVLEDRDHRTQEAASKDCRANAKDRSKRGVKIGFWRAWNRSEVENYFLEPAILNPVFCKVFAVSEQTVQDTLQEIIAATAVDQALQMCLSEFRSAFPDGPQSVGGVPRKTGRPCCDENGLVAPDVETVASLLGDVLDSAVERLAPEKCPDKESCLAAFQQRVDQWSSVALNDDVWRVDWAGKEILQLLRTHLSAKHGWPDETGSRVPVQWSTLSRQQSGELDRTIERALQPRLIRQFLSVLASNECVIPDVRDEWNSIIDGLHGATTGDEE